MINAAKITPDATNGYHQLRTSLATLNGTDIISAFVKADGYNYAQLASWANPNNYVNFDLTNGSVSAIGSIPPSIYGIDDYGNGWYRIYANVQASGGGIVGIGVITSGAAGWAQSFVGNETDGILIYGCQLEDASYPTSYIPTYGTSQTRGADAFSRNNIYTNGLITASGGTLFAEVRMPTKARDNGNDIIGIFDGTTQNGIFIYGGFGTFTYIVGKFVSGTFSNVLLSTVNQNNVIKVAIKWNGTTADIFENGVKVVSTTAFTATNMEFFKSNNSGVGTLTNVLQSILFPTPLTDTECIALTTL